MERESIVRQFESIGARVRFQALEAPRHRRVRVPDHALTIDLSKDRHGSYFVIALARSAPDLVVLQTARRERHLHLMSRNGHRFLCGHDERDWFVAELSERVSTVRAAKQALMPPAVRAAALRLSPTATERRRNAVFVRQGEWFFVPTGRVFPEEVIHRDEPLQRAPGSKPHVCEELCREGGDLVYIVGGGVFTPEQYAARLRADKDDTFRRLRKEERMRNPEVYVRGAVKHPDHATVHLETWHRVYVSNEVQAGAPGSSVAFLD